MFNSELASLTALGSTGTIKVVVPLHVGTLPKVGTIGPGTKPALANTSGPRLASSCCSVCSALHYAYVLQT